MEVVWERWLCSDSTWIALPSRRPESSPSRSRQQGSAPNFNSTTGTQTVPKVLFLACEEGQEMKWATIHQ